MKNIGELMKKAQAVQSQINILQAKMEKQEFEGISGGGAVRILMTGKGAPVKLSLDKSVVDPADVETLEDLILIAIRDSQAKAQETMNAEMKRIQGSLGLPADMKLPF